MDELFDDINFDEGKLPNEGVTNQDPGTGLNEDIFGGDPNNEEQPSTIITALLKANGITDPNKISVLNGDETEEVSFYSLTEEEQMSLLLPQAEETPELDEDEVTFLNTLRENGYSIEQYLEAYKNKVLEEIGTTPEVTYNIDSYSDDELFLLDLKNKYDNLTDEELNSELDKEKQNEDLFKKKVDKLRQEYKTLEDAEMQRQQELFEQQQQQQYSDFVDVMKGVAVDTPELYNFELEDEEKEDILSFLLDLDESGTSEFSKALSDPKTLYEIAWFIKYGPQAMETIKSAYESEIANLKKDPVKKIVIGTKEKTFDPFDTI